MIEGCKVLVVEDKKLHADKLVSLLQQIGYDTSSLILQQYKNIVDYCKESKFDIVFLDLELGNEKLAGAYIARDLLKVGFKIIFCTGMDSDTLLDAIDIAQTHKFLRKKLSTPIIQLGEIIDKTGLAHAIIEVLNSSRSKDIISKEFNAEGVNNIFIQTKYKKEGLKIRKLRLQDIIYFEATNRYITFHLEFEDVLSYSKRNFDSFINEINMPELFFKINRSEAINRAYIEELDVKNNKIRLKYIKEPLSLPKKQKTAFCDWLQEYTAIY